MERELKFRVWDKQFKRMKLTGIGFNHGVLSGDDVEIMQFTGLKDKNGKEIYEGDIIKWLGFEAREGRQIRPERIKVVANEVSSYIESCFRLRNILSTNSTVEVIGNIYENPELIGDK